jgi:hypothetical protein
LDKLRNFELVAVYKSSKLSSAAGSFSFVDGTFWGSSGISEFGENLILLFSSKNGPLYDMLPE